MRKEIITGGIITIIIAAAVGTIVLFAPQAIPTESGFQFDKSKTASTPNRIFFEIKADDANLSIVYEDNTDLLYSINITPYPSSTEATLRTQIEEDSWGLFLNAERQESIDITLGTGCFYRFRVIDSSNVNATVVYSNNVWANSSALDYLVDDGDLTLRVLSDIGVSNTDGFDFYVRCRILNLEIDVAEGWAAYVDFYDSNLTILEMTGWRESGGEQGYVHKPADYTIETPMLRLDVYVEEAYARLTAQES